MNQSTCSVDGCESAALSRGWCGKHYARWRAHGDAQYTNHRTGCLVEACSGKHCAGGYCSMHHRRLLKYGDVNHLERSPNIGDCAVPGCPMPMRKRKYCANHYQMLRVFGEIRERHYKWAERSSHCRECGGPMSDFKSRTYCSANCYARGRRAGGQRPTEIRCARCSTRVSLTERSKSGRVKRADTLLCLPCRKQNKFGMNVRELANRDGTDCRICGETVNMALKRPSSLFGPSVDHIVPRAHGGSDDSTNLQLAHYWCNAVKSDRIDFVIR